MSYKIFSLKKLNPINNVFYGWKLVAIAVTTMTLIITPIFSGLGFFFVGLEREFGWTRGMLSIPFSLARMEGAILGPVEGYTVDRIGPRKTIMIGLLLLSIGFLWFSWIPNFMHFILAFCVITAGGALGGFMPLMAAINNWFRRKRSTAMAFGMLGISFGGFLAPLLGVAIDEFGWRMVTRSLGIIVALLIFPIGFSVRNRPEDYGQLPDGDVGIESEEYFESNSPEISISVKSALKFRGFWLVSFTHGMSAVAPVTLGIHLIPALNDAGWSLSLAGSVLFAQAFSTAIFQLLGGYIGDRIRKEPAITVCCCLQAIGILVLAIGLSMESGAVVYPGIMIYGAGLGGRVPLLISIRGDYFGRDNYATIMGFSQIPMNLIMMGAPTAAGFLFDNFSSYTIPFVGLAFLNIIGGIIMLWSRHPNSTETPSFTSKSFWTRSNPIERNING